MEILNGIIKLIFPPRCIFCNELTALEEGVDICPTCYKKIPFTAGTSIRMDVKTLFCDKIIWVCEYSGIVKHSLIKFKFHNKPSYYRAFARLLAEKVKKMTNCAEFDIIISVPLHKQRENARGYNQALLISKAVGRELGIPEKSGLLVRVKNTDSQSHLSKVERQVNVKDAFEVRNAMLVKDRTILLIDDVLTTGNTLNECGRLLKQAGAKKVVAAAFASGRRD